MDDDTAAAPRCPGLPRGLARHGGRLAWRDSAGRIGPCLEQLEPVRRNPHPPRLRTACPTARSPGAWRRHWAPSRPGSGAVWPPCGSASDEHEPARRHAPRHPPAGRRIRAGHAPGRPPAGGPGPSQARPAAAGRRAGLGGAPAAPHRPGRAGGAVAPAVGPHRAQPRCAGHAGTPTRPSAGTAPPRVALGQPRALRRGLTAGGFALATVLAAVLVGRLAEPAPETRFMVVLVAPDDKAPGWVVQAGASGARQVELIPPRRRRGAARQGPAVLDQGRRLGRAGVPGPRHAGQDPAGAGGQAAGGAARPALRADPEDTRSGSPTGRPTGPVRYIGRAVKVM